MNNGLVLVGCLLVAVGGIVAVIFVAPKFRAWKEKKVKKETFDSEKEKLIVLEQEVKFHLSWAKDRGDSIANFEQELGQIHHDLEELEKKNPSIELSGIKII